MSSQNDPKADWTCSLCGTVVKNSNPGGIDVHKRSKKCVKLVKKQSKGIGIGPMYQFLRPKSNALLRSKSCVIVCVFMIILLLKYKSKYDH